MKNDFLTVVLLITLCFLTMESAAEVQKTVWPDAPERSFIFIENNNDDNYFVTPLNILDPRMTGASRWTGLKYTGSGAIYQQSLGYIDNGYNTPLTVRNRYDMWLENSPLSYPLVGLRCINWYSGCDMDTSYIPPDSTDSKGFYGVTVTPGGLKWMHGLMSDSFYYYLKNIPVRGRLSMQVNNCTTSVNYDASKGERCKDQGSGRWYVRNMSFVKSAHLRLNNTNALTEVFVSSDGEPTLGAGNSDCRIQTIGALKGISCKMVSYSLEGTNISSAALHIFPSINNAALSSAISNYDVQFSLDGNSWKPVVGVSSFYTLNNMMSSNSIYVFLSSNFFKKMVQLGIGNSDTKGLLNFRLRNIISPESGWYEFSTSNMLFVKPRDFSVSIISDDFSLSPSRLGNVGPTEPSLEFGYIVTTSGKTTADKVLIKITGPTRRINGRSYCIFSTPTGQQKIPFPAKLVLMSIWGFNYELDNGCDGVWYNLNSVLWLNTPWSDGSANTGLLSKTNVIFSILMNDPISLRTVDNQDWAGYGFASGEVHVQAIWNNIN